MKIWSHGRGIGQSVPSLGENITRVEWKLHFAGANISLGLWKIPFKWSQAEKRQRICLAFCLSVFSAYTTRSATFFSPDGAAQRRVLGKQIWWVGGSTNTLATLTCVAVNHLLWRALPPSPFVSSAVWAASSDHWNTLTTLPQMESVQFVPPSFFLLPHTKSLPDLRLPLLSKYDPDSITCACVSVCECMF